MKSKLFITGTDTEVGKTYVSVEFLKYFTSLGCKTLGLKPIASGCYKTNGQLYNNDALKLQKASSIQLDYNKINPIKYKLPIAPHIAAKKNNEKLSISKLMSVTEKSLSMKTHITIIEGVGGWFVPLNSTESMADFVIKNKFDVILVVGIKLGCLNHAILTYNAFLKSKISFIGWVANCLDKNCKEIDENIRTLKSWIKEPCISIVEYNQKLKPTEEFKIIFNSHINKQCN